MRTAGLMQAPIQFADHQARRGLTAPYSNGRRGKEYHAVMDGRPVGGIFSVGVEEPHRWKDSVQSEAEIRLWVASGTAQGMRPWFAKFAGVLRDRRWLPVVERIYDWHHRHERYLRNTRSLARVALLFSEQSASVYAPGPGRPLADHVAGMYHALVEARVPFDLVHEAFLTPEALDRYALVVLANAAALVGRTVRGAPRLRRARRRPPGDVRELALRRVRQAAARLRPRRRVRRPRHRRCRGPDEELLPDARGRGRVAARRAARPR